MTVKRSAATVQQRLEQGLGAFVESEEAEQRRLEEEAEQARQEALALKKEWYKGAFFFSFPTLWEGGTQQGAPEYNNNRICDLLFVVVLMCGGVIM